MKIQINTDKRITGDEILIDRYQHVIEDVLNRFSNRITRVEVYLSDVDGPKSGIDDKYCLIEARLQGLQAIVTSQNADNLTQAVMGAAKKMEKSISKMLERLQTL